MDFNPGDRVIYRAYQDAVPEDGEVIRVNAEAEYVFVRYRGSQTPKATRPEDLEKW